MALQLIHQGAQRGGGCADLQFARLGARQVEGVAQAVQHVLGGIHDGPGMGLGGLVQRLAMQQLGHGQHPVHRGAEFAVQQAHEAAFVPRRGLERALGRVGGAELLDQALVLVTLVFIDCAQQGYGRADAAIGSAMRDDEAAHQGAGTALQDDGGKGVHPNAGFDHGRFRVHHMDDLAGSVQALAQRAGQLQQEVSALNQADRAIAVDDRYHQGVRFALEPRENVAGHGGFRHRLHAVSQHFNRRHSAGSY